MTGMYRPRVSIYEWVSILPPFILVRCLQLTTISPPPSPLSAQEVDVLGGMLAMSPDRYSEIDFTPVINAEHHAMMIKFPSLEPDMAGFVKPFSIYVGTGCVLLNWAVNEIVAM